MKVATTSQAKAILRRIAGKGPGWAFTPQDFADIGDSRSIGMALTRLVREDKIRRIGHGLYDRPHSHPLLGQVGADANAVVQAIARKRHLRLLPSPQVAANLLGLTTQVPARIVYHTDGAPTRITVGKLQIDLRRNTGRLLKLAERASGLVAQALRNFGKDNITRDQLRIIHDKVSDKDRKQLMQDVLLVPAWMRPHFREIARTHD